MADRLGLLVRDDRPIVDRVGQIVQVATTGQTGDGLVWVSDVQRAVFIRKTTGPDA